METREEVEKRKTQSREPLNTELRHKPWIIYENHLNESKIEFPKRPQHISHHKKEEQERLEWVAFKEWQQTMKTYPPERLNYFEQNIEVRMHISITL